MSLDISLACPAPGDDLLGEGPCWHPSEARLYWVDIRKSRLNWLEPNSGRRGCRTLTVAATALGARRGGGLVMATRAGVGVFDTTSAVFQLRLEVEPDRPGNRTNDGNVGADGRFWFATMDDAEHESSGAVYRLDAQWRCVRVLDGLRVPNALVTSPDGRRLYVADSACGRLDAYPLDPATGALGPAEAFARTAGAAAPDGAAVDAEGCVWSAEWDGWRLVRYRPDGSIERTIATPFARPTSCAFGGDDLRTLYVTSARIGLDPADTAAQPLAGSLMSLRAPAPGAGAALFDG